MKARLYRSRTDRMLGGVCGGLGGYLGVDPTLVRLIFVLVGFTTGLLVIYPVLWIVMPAEGQGDLATSETMDAAATEMAAQARALGSRLRSGSRESDPTVGMFIGAGLVLMGTVFLVQNLQISWLHWLNMDLVWPLLLIVVGIVLIQRRARVA